MIGSIKGKIILKTEKFLIVEVNGVGYKVFASADVSLQTKLDNNIFLFIHTHVREDAIDLYGFINRDELTFFEMLLGVSGIGPKSAIAILGIATLSTLKKAVASGDTAYLTKVSGIGRKTAEKIVIELRDKIGEAEEGEMLKDEIDALEALKALGYAQHEAREALKKVPNNTNTNTKIKEALKILGGK